MLAEQAAVEHRGNDLLAVCLLDAQFELPIVEQQAIAARDRARQRRIRGRDAVDRSGKVTGANPECRTDGERNSRAALERARADLRAAQVLQNRHDPAGALCRGADAGDDLGMALVGAVREVETKDVDSGLDQVLECLDGIAGRPDRGNDLRVSHAKELTIPAVVRPTTSGVMQ